MDAFSDLDNADVETLRNSNSNSNTCFIDVSNDIVRNIEQSQIRFTEITDLKISVTDSSSLLLLSAENIFLSTIKVYQAFNQLNYPTDQNLILDHTSYCKQSTDINHKFDEGNFKRLVISIESNAKNSTFNDLIDHLTQLIQDIPEVKVVIIVNHLDTNKLLVKLTTYCYEFKVLRDAELDFHSLTFDSQNHLLSKDVLFQGKLIPLNKVVTESNYQLINSETVVKLLSDTVLSIGNPIPLTEAYDAQTYVDRTFKNKRILKLDVLKADNNLHDKFAIAGIEFQDLENITNPLDKICLFENYNDNDLIKFVILNSKTAAEQFRKLTLLTKRKCHWLSKVADGLLWHNSTGNHDFLRQYINTGLTKTCDEPNLVSVSADSTVFVISGDTGSGKSTTLTHLGTLIKEQFNNRWVIRINLRNYNSTFQTKLKSNCPFTVSEAINFLFCSQNAVQIETGNENSSFDEKLFKSMLENVVVMFDEFDEVPTRFVDAVKSLISATIVANVQQIWLTTRLDHASNVVVTEDGFQCFLYEICPLKKQDQISVIVKHWKYRLGELNDEALLRFYAENLLKQSSRCLLETVLLAEIYSDNLKELENLTENSQMSASDLYAKFLEKKFNHSKNKTELKRDSSETNPNLDYEVFIQIHQIAALYLFFYQTEISELISCVYGNDKQFDFDRMERYGIATNFTTDHPTFRYLTIAEYLIAVFFANMLLKPCTNSAIDTLQVLLLSQKSFHKIRYFLNEMLEDKIISQNNLNKFRDRFEHLWDNDAFGKSETILHVALKENNNVIFKLLQQSLIHSNLVFKLANTIRNRQNAGILHVAIENDNIAAIKTLIEDFKADVNAVDNAGRTPLHLAVAKNNKVVVEMLVKSYNVNVNAVDHFDKTPLHLAISLRNNEIADMLIASPLIFVDVGLPSTTTMLHVAVVSGNADIIRMLIKHNKSNVNAVDNEGSTPLHTAVLNNNKEIVKLLITEGNASVNACFKNGYTPLHLAVIANFKDLIEMLIQDFNADLNACDIFGYTPLFSAILTNKTDIAEMLMKEYVADVNAADNKSLTLLHWAAMRNNSKIVDMLIKDYNANVNATDKNGQTPLHLAVQCNIVTMIEFLINDYNADVNFKDDKGNTPLHDAINRRNEQVVRMLIENFNADLQAKNKAGHSALHLAATTNNHQLIELLVDKYKLDVNLADNDGRTPLHLAAINNNKETFQKLIVNLNANLHAADKYGNTPIGEATARNNKEIVGVAMKFYKDKVCVIQLVCPICKQLISINQRSTTEALVSVWRSAGFDVYQNPPSF